MGAAKLIVLLAESDRAIYAEAVVGGNTVGNYTTAFHIMVGASGFGVSDAEEALAHAATLPAGGYTEVTCGVFTGDSFRR